MANRSRKSSKGNFSGIVFGLVLLGAIFAFFQVPHNPSISGIWNILVSKSETVEAWAKNVSEGLSNGTFNPFDGTGGNGSSQDEKAGMGDSPTPTGAELQTKIDTLTVGGSQNVAYNRDEWKHWVSVNGGCWDAREQVLYEEVEPNTIVLLDKSKKETTDINSACSIKSGKWIDPYTGGEMTNPSKIDIDHMVPLSWAAKHGGQAWDANKKSEYANSLTYKNHLIVSSPTANRTKSDQGPSTWKPDNKEYWCTYATSWTDIISQWQLTVDEADKVALKEMASTC